MTGSQLLAFVMLLVLLGILVLVMASIAGSTRLRAAELEREKEHRTGRKHSPAIIGPNSPIIPEYQRQCPICKCVNKLRSKHCGHCGAWLNQDPIRYSSNPCPSCHQPVHSGVRFCGACGEQMPKRHIQMNTESSLG